MQDIYSFIGITDNSRSHSAKRICLDVTLANRLVANGDALWNGYDPGLHAYVLSALDTSSPCAELVNQRQLRKVFKQQIRGLVDKSLPNKRIFCCIEHENQSLVIALTKPNAHWFLHYLEKVEIDE